MEKGYAKYRESYVDNLLSENEQLKKDLFQLKTGNEYLKSINTQMRDALTDLIEKVSKLDGMYVHGVERPKIMAELWESHTRAEKALSQTQPKEQEEEREYEFAKKWYKQGALDASPDGQLFEDGIDADFYNMYGKQFRDKKAAAGAAAEK